MNTLLINWMNRLYYLIQVENRNYLKPFLKILKTVYKIRTRILFKFLSKNAVTGFQPK